MHEAALVLGLDLGARFVRGSISDLAGDVRARQDVELPSADADRTLAAITTLGTSLIEATGLSRELVNGAVVGVPGVVDDAGRLYLTHFRSLEGRELRRELSERLAMPVTLDNDINLAALGEQAHGVARGVDDFAFLSVCTGLGIGLVLRGELHRGRHGAAGELDYALLGFGQDVDPSANGVVEVATELARGSESTLVAPYDARDVFEHARRGDDLARRVVTEVAHRIALHIAPISAVADVSLVVLGGGIGANGDLLLDPIRGELAAWLPYPPRVEISSLGEAAVLTGALAVGLRSALDNVFAQRRSAPR